MDEPTAAILIIGDEILSGRTRDANMHFLAGALNEKGIRLCEARMIADDHETIRDTLRELSSRYSHVFTSGGIGPTHDDITADAVAAAFNRPIDVRQDAKDLLVEHYAKSGIELNEARLRMARIPEGASLIDNPVSAAPGFVLENVHVMAGVPAIFEAMVASVLPGLTGGTPVQSVSMRVERPEGEIAQALGAVSQRYPDLSFGSYPFIQNGSYATNVVIRGTSETELDSARAEAQAAFDAL